MHLANHKFSEVKKLSVKAAQDMKGSCGSLHLAAPRGSYYNDCLDPADPYVGEVSVVRPFVCPALRKLPTDQEH